MFSGFESAGRILSPAIGTNYFGFAHARTHSLLKTCSFYSLNNCQNSEKKSKNSGKPRGDSLERSVIIFVFGVCTIYFPAVPMCTTGEYARNHKNW